MRAEVPPRRRRGIRLIVVITMLLGVLTAVGVAAGTRPAERTFATVSEPTQTLMSVTVPFLGVLLVGQLRHPFRPAAILATVGRALGLARLVAVFGVLVCAAVTAIAPSTAVADRWENAELVARFEAIRK